MLNKKIEKVLKEQDFTGNKEITKIVYNKLFNIAETYTKKYDVHNKILNCYETDFIDYRYYDDELVQRFKPEHYMDRRNGNATNENYFVGVCAGKKKIFLFLCFYCYEPEYMKKYRDELYYKFHSNTAKWCLLKYKIDEIDEVSKDFEEILKDMYEGGCKKLNMRKCFIYRKRK